jgi:hypothetical protein
MFYPSLALDRHWSAYSAIQVSSSPYSYFEATSATNRIKARVIQAFGQYTRESGNRSFAVKAGQLSSAFGSFPLRYDVTQNSLLDAPLSYGGRDYGFFPVTLYGLSGVEVDSSIARLDARLQLTNSSPANSKNLLSQDQHLNWTGGLGYTISHGFRIGASIYHGPYLQVGRFLLPSENSSDWPLTAAGVDAQWAHGRYSLNGEWQRFYYLYPRYKISPILKYGYVEAKVVVHPRLYMAARTGYNTLSQFQTRSMTAPASFGPNRQSIELAAGYRLSRSNLLKFGYEWLHTNGSLDANDNIAGVQFVTSIDALFKAFH